VITVSVDETCRTVWLAEQNPEMSRKDVNAHGLIKKLIL
jgi:hypothetical protein